jgi:hypothetical protein
MAKILPKGYIHQNYNKNVNLTTPWEHHISVLDVSANLQPIELTKLNLNLVLGCNLQENSIR